MWLPIRIGTLRANSSAVRSAQRAIAGGATEIHVKSAQEAGEVFVTTFHGGNGPGYRNTTGLMGEVLHDPYMYPNGKAGTYH